MADRSQLMIEMILDDKQALSRLGSAVSKMEKETKSATESMSKNYGAVIAQITATVAAGEGFRRFMAESIKQAAEQEDAVNRLNVALKNQGTFTVELSKSYQDMADSIQRSTRFSDDAILQAQQTLVTLGNVGPSNMAKVTNAVIDFSTATRTDLQTSAELFAKASAGNTAALARYGIIIDETIPKSQRFAELMRITQERMGGSAAADVKTYNGAMLQLNHSYGEFQEQIGMLVTKNPMVLMAINEIKKALDGLAETIKNNQQASMGLVNSGIFGLAGQIGAQIGQNLFGINNQAPDPQNDPRVSNEAAVLSLLAQMRADFSQQDLSRMLADTDVYKQIQNEAAQKSINAELAKLNVKKQLSEEEKKLKLALTQTLVKLENDGNKAKLQSSIAFAQVTAEVTMGLAQLSGKASLKAIAIVVQGITQALQAVAIAANPFLAILKIAAITINTAVALKQLSESEKALDDMRNQKFETPNLPGLASGGTVSRGGSVLVGESGPEILRLPTGAQVIPLNRGGASSNLVINIEMNNPVLSNNQIADDFAQAIAERVSAFIDNERARL